MTLLSLVAKQNNKCYYCNCEMNSIKNSTQHVTIEHLRDKWASPRNKKIESSSNLVAACFDCNNSRGNRRNRIARDYYKLQAAKKNMKLAVASTSSAILYKLFGSVPQHLFNESSHDAI